MAARYEGLLYPCHQPHVCASTRNPVNVENLFCRCSTSSVLWATSAFMRSPVGARQILQCPLSLLLLPNEPIAAARNAVRLPKQYPMNKNYLRAYMSCPMLPLRACHWLHVADCVNRRLFRSWRFLPALCDRCALVECGRYASGDDHGYEWDMTTDQVPYGKRFLMLRRGDTINFAPSVTTVNLSTDELVIDKNLTVTGPFADRVTVRRSTQCSCVSNFPHHIKHRHRFYLPPHDFKWQCMRGTMAMGEVFAAPAC